MLPPHATAGPAEDVGTRAIIALERLLERQRIALVTGNLDDLQAAKTDLQGLLTNPSWLRSAAVCRDAARLRAGLRAMAVNADLAARGDAQTTRGLAALGRAPTVYGASGVLGSRAASGAAGSCAPAGRSARSISA